MPLDAASVQEASAFMRWLADDNFTFLGYREYEVTDADGDRKTRIVPALDQDACDLCIADKQIVRPFHLE